MRKQWSITIIVLFVLCVSALIAIIAVRSLQQQLLQSSELTNYYQAYYHARAGIEQELTTLSTRWPGRQTDLTGDGFVVHTLARTSSLGQGSNGNACSGYVLETGQSLIIPLFVDDGQNTSKGVRSGTSLLTDIKGNNQRIMTSTRGSGLLLALTPALTSGDTINLAHKIFYKNITLKGSNSNTDISDFLYDTPVDPQAPVWQPTDGSVAPSTTYEPLMWSKNGLQGRLNYLLIYNNDPKVEASFCLSTARAAFAAPEVVINSMGIYRDTTVSLTAQKQNIYPDFLFFSYIQQTHE